MAGKQGVDPAERSQKARAIHTDLDDEAAAINAAHARILNRVLEAQVWKVHRDVDGFSALRDWLISKFDFHHKVAADLAAIARSARTFAVLTETATSGAARVDQAAYAVRALGKTPAMRLYARTPIGSRCPPLRPGGPVPDSRASGRPVLPARDLCRPPGASGRDRSRLREGGGAVRRALRAGPGAAGGVETENGMWALDGMLTADTGAMFAKLLTTAVPPPRAEDCQNEQDQARAGTDQAGPEDETETGAEAVLPAQANRNAEALHQMLASFGADPAAPRRHGHTATLNLTCDIETLRGEDTGRLPLLEGEPISLAKARLLACEAAIIPSMFHYGTGEAIELGRAERLPNAALRRKLELEQPGGCAWSGCSRPVQWTEAHHLVHWADGGLTNAENLILLCRFHHGRVHTPGWSVTKTGPGQALIVHHDGHQAAPADMLEDGQDACGCPDWRTATDLEREFEDDLSNTFPIGLYPEEWAPALKEDLNRVAEQAETETAWAAARTARDKMRTRFTTKTTSTAEPETALESACAATDPGPPPFLTRPIGRPIGDAHQKDRATRTHPIGFGPSPCPTPWNPKRDRPPATGHRPPATGHRRTLDRPDPRPTHPAAIPHLTVADRLNPGHTWPDGRTTPPRPSPRPPVAARSNHNPNEPASQTLTPRSHYATQDCPK
ncbi:hypothetical protein GCM10029992_55630 [Glycomyces albus]